MDGEKMLPMVDEYLAAFDVSKTIEDIFVRFAWQTRIYRRFDKYLVKNNICVEMPKRSKQQLERRRLFIHWYVDTNPNKNLNQCVTDLKDLLFCSEATIYHVLFNYR